ncbi:MAG: ABC transporter permease [Clostridia bacterium]|nr:ABC transporter permease [Clostridia bacterium]
MSKLSKLYKNEMKRVILRPTMWIGLLLAFALTAGMALKGRATILESRQNMSEGEYLNNLKQQIMLEKERIKSYNEALSVAEKQLAESDSSSSEYHTAVSSAIKSRRGLTCSRARISVLQMKLDNRLTVNDYRSATLDVLLRNYEGAEVHNPAYGYGSLEYALEKLNEAITVIPVDEQAFSDRLAALEPAVKSDDFAYFLDELITAKESEPESPLRDATLEAYSLVKSYGPEKLSHAGVQEVIRRVSDYAFAKVSYLDVSDKNNRGIQSETLKKSTTIYNLLTADLENNISGERAARITSFDPKLPTDSTVSDPNNVISMSVGIVGMLGVLLTVLVIAGSSVAGEIRSGSIKSLIVAPVKRRKIFASKVLMILTVTLFLSLAVSAFGLLFGSAITGVWDHGRVLYNSGTEARIMPFWAATLLTSLVDAYGIFFLAMIALTLSCLTRNSVVSVLAPAGYYIGKVLIDIAGGLTSDRFVNAVLPMENFRNLCFTKDAGSLINASRLIFGSLDSDSPFGEAINYIMHPVTTVYSLIFTLVLIAIIIWVAGDAFCRRDIT